MRANEKLYKLLGYFHNRKNELIDSYNSELQELLDVGQRQLARELQTLSENFGAIVEVQNGKKKAYKLIDKIDILTEMFHTDYEYLDILYTMAKEGMPELFKEIEKSTKNSNTPYIFYSQPLEDIKDLQQNNNFKKLKNAIVNRKYITIIMDDNEKFTDAKPIKILFSDGNWYIALVYNDRLYIRRINFIKSLLEPNKKESFQLSNLEKFIQYLKTDFQNSMSLHGINPQKAKLLANPKIARYFKPNMKKFLKTQRFIKEHNDGSIEFEVKYTQELEILPFVQKWLPNLIILEPKELKEAYLQNLKEALEKTNNSRIG